MVDKYSIYFFDNDYIPFYFMVDLLKNNLKIKEKEAVRLTKSLNKTGVIKICTFPSEIIEALKRDIENYSAFFKVKIEFYIEKENQKEKHVR